MRQKHNLWRKQSYVRVEKNEPRCIWAVFRIFNYNRWYKVKKTLSYKKDASHESSINSKVSPDEQYLITDVHELEDSDKKMLNSDSLNSFACKALSSLIEEEDNSRKMDLIDQPPKWQAFEDDELSTSTLLARLKVDPKMDSPKNHKLARSGTYPSPNTSRSFGFGTTPSKLENKHTEIWPVINQGLELSREKSQGFRRSSSLSEPLDRFGYMFDRSKSRKDWTKFPTFSEKEFASLGDHHFPLQLHRKSFSDRLSFLDTESYSFSSHEAPQLSFELNGQTKGSRLDSPRNSDITTHTVNLAEPQLDENKDNFVSEQGKSTDLEKQERIGEIDVSHDKTEDAETTLSQDSAIMSQSIENVETTQDMDDFNEEFEYVNHTLDVLGFTEREDQYGVWESLDESLDPTLFDEIEVLCPFNPHNSTKEAVIGMSSSERRVLFHLIIEALVDIREKSLSHYLSNSLSFGIQIEAISKGKKRIVEEVWKLVNKYLQWRPGLEYAVAHYLSKSISDWKNPQMEIEYAGLHLEDLIFDELLDEFFSC